MEYKLFNDLNVLLTQLSNNATINFTTEHFCQILTHREDNLLNMHHTILVYRNTYLNFYSTQGLKSIRK